MNTLTRTAAASADMGWLLGVMTAVFLVFFLSWAWWAFNPRNRARMDEAAQMPLNDGVDG